MSKEDNNNSFIKDLWERRFFQYVATYIGVSWAIIQFTEWVVQRYDLMPSLVEKVIIFLVVMLPGVMVFIYNHGRPGADRWMPVEKLLLPGSAITAIILAFALFNSAPAKAQIKTVTLTNESGDTITRNIPSLEITRRFVIFPFENKTGNEELDWWEVGTAYLLDKDLEQDMRTFSIQPLSLKYHYESYNHTYLDDIPFSSKIKVAQDLYSDYFIVGELSRENEMFAIDIQVYNSNSGKQFYTKKFSHTDVFSMMDEISLDLSEHVYLPEANDESFSFIDLPASNLVTADVGAYKSYIDGAVLEAMNVQNLERAKEKLEESISLDASCAECYHQLSIFYSSLSDDKKGIEFSDKAIQLSNNLPERQQLNIRYFNYAVKNQPEKAIALNENWRKLYPNDYTPYRNLITFYQRILQWDKAKKIGEVARSNGHKGDLLKTLTNLYIQTGDYDKAQEYMEEFATLYPHKAKDRLQLGDIYINKGELQKAKTFFNDYLLMEPNDVGAILKLAGVEMKLGKLEDALYLSAEALSQSNQTEDSIGVYQFIESYYERQGQYSRSFEIANIREQLMAKVNPPTLYKQLLFFTQLSKWLATGNDELFLSKQEELNQLLPTSSPIINCISNFLFHMIKENLEQFENYYRECESVLTRFNGEYFKYAVEGVSHRLRGEFLEAAKSYETYQDSTGFKTNIFDLELSEVYRKGGKIEKAQSLIEKQLKLDPTNPAALIEASKIMKAKNQINQARECFEKGLEIWKEADPEFILYKEALEYQKTLEAES